MLLGCCHCGERESETSDSPPSESVPSESQPSESSLSWDPPAVCGYCRAVPLQFQVEITEPMSEFCKCALEGPYELNGPFDGGLDNSTGQLHDDGCSWYSNEPMKAFYPDEEGGPLVCHDHPDHSSTDLDNPLWTLITYPFSGYQITILLLRWMVTSTVGGGSFLGTYHWARYVTASREAVGSPPSVNCLFNEAFTLDAYDVLWPPQPTEFDICEHMTTVGVSPL